MPTSKPGEEWILKTWDTFLAIAQIISLYNFCESWQPPWDTHTYIWNGKILISVFPTASEPQLGKFSLSLNGLKK